MKKFILLILSVINAIVSGIYIAMSPLEVVPSHYNIRGEVDAYSTKWFYMLMPCLLILIAVIYFVRCIYAKKSKLENYDEKNEFKIIVAIFAFLVVLFWYLSVVAINGAMNVSSSLSSLLNILMGVLFIYLSNMFGKTKQNRFFGIRIGSTLKSKSVWKKTHRLGGYMGVISGFLMVILGIISLFVNTISSYLLSISLGIYVVLGVIIPIVYSYILYSKEKNK